MFNTESDQISLTLLANEEKPVENICLVFKHWNSRQEAIVSIDGSEVDSKQGIVRDTDGSYKLIIWLAKSSNQAFNMSIKNQTKL